MEKKRKLSSFRQFRNHATQCWTDGTVAWGGMRTMWQKPSPWGLAIPAPKLHDLQKCVGLKLDWVVTNWNHWIAKFKLDCASGSKMQLVFVAATVFKQCVFFSEHTRHCFNCEWLIKLSPKASFNQMISFKFLLQLSSQLHQNNCVSEKILLHGIQTNSFFFHLQAKLHFFFSMSFSVVWLWVMCIKLQKLS